ncbi:Uncharacterized conserved protein, DUF433 family [Bryocella elongata]|uniref:Uncharacterized conserved protein, DUF433 family n=2 Tax=Bryocella elongata TaxID=863522 RepID=A0A1H6A8N8_9BACT|nr:Uncharacterized conserved protein, DUF433 family [Bryocella elongata]
MYDAPAYSVVQAAHYVGLPTATLRDWVGPRGLIMTPKPKNLSFNNLAEAHVLRAMRRHHKLPMQGIRKALEQLALIHGTPHPLLDESFRTDGVSLCIEEEGRVVNLTRKLQTEMREFVDLYCDRIQRQDGQAAKLYPFIKNESADAPRHISISPVIAFGRPVLADTGISTAVIAGRFMADDSITDLAQEYAVEIGALEDAIRWEMLKGKAA